MLFLVLHTCYENDKCTQCGKNNITMQFPFTPQSEHMHFMVLMFLQEDRVEITGPFVREDA